MTLNTTDSQVRWRYLSQVDDFNHVGKKGKNCWLTSERDNLF